MFGKSPLKGLAPKRVLSSSFGSELVNGELAPGASVQSDEALMDCEQPVHRNLF